MRWNAHSMHFAPNRIEAAVRSGIETGEIAVWEGIRRRMPVFVDGRGVFSNKLKCLPGTAWGIYPVIGHDFKPRD